MRCKMRFLSALFIIIIIIIIIMLHMGLENIVRNSMMFDLGLESKYFENRNAVMQYVKYIEEEYDLV